jgi:predicted metal-binding protein
MVSVVGNPAMQQLFMGLLPENLARIPFAPVLKQLHTVPAVNYISSCCQAQMLIVPDISGFVGADTVAAALAAGLDRQEEITLLVDIGTNAEMVLGNRERLVASSAAAGPALEGANITFGMRGQTGAIDHVRMVDGKIRCSVIDGGEATGICGSGLIDAVAVALNAGLINRRGRILDPSRRIALTDRVYLTQDDIRQVQLAKGAIAAGIELLAAQLGIEVRDIQKVQLAGAFGTFMDPTSACRIGLLPAALEDRVEALGNAAGSGAKLLCCNNQTWQRAQELATRAEFVELASVAGFGRSFARNMSFYTPEYYWIEKAQALGFTHVTALDVATLEPRQDVRDMCRADLCRAYGKNWTCPPHCGTLEECHRKLRRYSRGILLQTVGKTEKRIDTAAYRRTEEAHMRQFHRLAEEIRAVYPQALCLGAGGCRICGECAYPEPCRFPQKAYASMEAYGLFVTQVCRDNGCQYHHGERTITYTACILFS